MNVKETLFQASMCLFIIASLFSNAQLSIAENSKKSTFTVPLSRSMKYKDIRSKAERMTNEYITSSFAEDPLLGRLRLDVLGQQSVEIVPLFSLNITRAQWLESPHISHWVSYNQASFSLLQTDSSLIARAEENPVATSFSRATFESPVERQVMVNNLPETEIIQLVDKGADPQRLIERGVNPQFLIDELD